MVSINLHHITLYNYDVILCTGEMLDHEPVGFEVNREDIGGEKIKVLYSRQNDKFLQM